MVSSIPLLSVLMTSPGCAREAALGARARGVCVRCGKAPVFRDVSDLSEYRISALCGVCWDVVVGGDEGE